MTAGGDWWIEADGRTWGPFPAARLTGFVAEGRLTASTLVSRSAGGPFGPAGREPDLASTLFPQATVGGERPLLVVADLRATGADALEAALAAYGETVRVRPGLWLLRGRLSPSGLRNAVSRRLAPADMLMVIEADAAHAAWFNLDGDTDRALRRLWGGPPSEG